jgi:biofilm protein TabA
VLRQWEPVPSAFISKKVSSPDSTHRAFTGLNPALPRSGERREVTAMAFFGPFPHLRAQLAPHARFAAAFNYVADALRSGSDAHRRILALASGVTERIDLAGGAFALEQVYEARLRPEGFFESHRRYIDVQVIVQGIEAMEVAEISRLTITQPYREERDVAKYADVNEASRLIMRAGDVAVFFPDDGHMPSLRLEGHPILVRKTVVKVPVA